MSARVIEIPTLEDDGLLTPTVGDWLDKYQLIKLYSTVFTTSMREKWDSLVYIDLFAGAGRAKIRTSGRIVPASPLLALELEHRFNRYLFCEADAERLGALRKRVLRDHSSVDTRFVAGDVNESVTQILAGLPQYEKGYKVLGFCFVDPYRLSDLQFETIASLAERYMDFLVLIPTGYDATRNEGLYLEPSNLTIDRFLGNEAWRSAWESAKAKNHTFDRFMTDSFGESMKGLGYIYKGIDSTHLVKSTEKNLRLYRLALFSRHELGARFWREVRKYATPQQTLDFM